LTGKAFWYDASDASTITVATGVSEWRDKSGNALHLSQATGSLQPSWNSVDAITTDGVDDVLVSPSFNLFSLTDTGVGGTWAIVMRYTSGITPMAYNSPSGGRLGLEAANRVDWPNDNNGQLNSWSAGWSSSVYKVGTITKVVGTTLTVRLDGTQVAQHSVNNSFFNETAQLYLGGNVYGAGFYSAINIKEMVFTSLSDTPTVERLEGYLAWKYSLVSALPGGHPYKSAAPV
jgi:hypothetical protein